MEIVETHSKNSPHKILTPAKTLSAQKESVRCVPFHCTPYSFLKHSGQRSPLRTKKLPIMQLNNETLENAYFTPKYTPYQNLTPPMSLADPENGLGEEWLRSEPGNRN